MNARIQDQMRWQARKDDLATPLTGDEWARLRLELRDECANHPKTNPLYALATACEHDVPTEDYEDDLHKWSDDAEALLCLARVVDHACICQDGYCSQEASAREAHADLWYAVSLTKRRAVRAAHLATVVLDVWLTTHLTIEQAQDLAAECRTEDELRAQVRQQLKAQEEHPVDCMCWAHALGTHGRPDRLNPDCRDGKHAACNEDAWDEATDQPAPCECACHELEESNA